MGRWASRRRGAAAGPGVGQRASTPWLSWATSAVSALARVLDRASSGAHFFLQVDASDACGGRRGVKPRRRGTELRLDGRARLASITSSHARRI